MEIIRNGLTPETAILLKDNSGDTTSSVGEILCNMFGKENGSFFIYSETTLNNIDNTKRYKAYYIGDNNGNRHTIFFEIA